MSHSQLHDFSATKGLKEHSPPHFLKREGVLLESEKANKECGPGKKFELADYVSQSKSDPHAEPADDFPSWYKDHGQGSEHGEEDIEKEDRIQKGTSSKNGPRTDDSSTELSNSEWESNL